MKRETEAGDRHRKARPQGISCGATTLVDIPHCLKRSATAPVPDSHQRLLLPRSAFCEVLPPERLVRELITENSLLTKTLVVPAEL